MPRGPGKADVAFEAFRAQSEAPARAGRKRLWYAASIAVHGALIAVGIAYSFWHIEELTPPLLRVTFLSAAPPPPPAAPPPAGGGAVAKKKVAVKPKPVVQPKAEITQPREAPKKEEPKEEPKAEDQGEKGGVKGGVIGGTIGGTPGGTIGGTIGGTPGGVIGAPPGAPKFLAPNMGSKQILSGPEPPFPPSLRKGDVVYRVLVKICVTTTGAVDRVTLMKGADSVLDAGVLTTVKDSWRFRPLFANNTPVPFCYPATFEFKSHQ
jgi:periplasmic protein TonB